MHLVALPPWHGKAVFAVLEAEGILGDFGDFGVRPWVKLT